MHGVLTLGGVTSEADHDAATAVLPGDTFWLDLDLDAADRDVAGILGSELEIHPLAVDSALRFGQRPKIDGYDDHDYVVVHGAGPGGKGTAEVRLFFSERYVVPAHRGHFRAPDAVRERVGHHHASEVAAPQLVLVYLTVGSLTDGFFPVLSDLDDRLDKLEDAVLVRPTDEQLGDTFDMRRILLGIRRVVGPRRDMFASTVALPGAGAGGEAERYFRDLYDHLIRISDMVDNYRDLLGGVMGTRPSTVPNRLSVVMKQLAVIATVVVAVVVVLAVLLKRRGWLGGPTA